MNECYLLAYSPGLAQPVFLYQPGPPGPAVALPTVNWALSHQSQSRKCSADTQYPQADLKIILK